jgi:hypothetical protein
MKTSTILFLLCSLVGCATAPVTAATMPGAAAYRPLEVATKESAPALLAAAESVAIGLEVALVQTDGHRLTAIIPVEKGIRDKLVVEAGGGQLSVAYQTQIASHGAWIMADAVCAGYSHAREHTIAEKILAAVPMTMASAWR